MADWFVGPVMDKIINACSDYLQNQLRWQTGMKEELDRLRENQPKIRAVVSAYTRAQIRDRNPALNRWIWQLRDAIDEADDVLDDFEYMKIEEQLELNMEETKVRSSLARLFLEPARKLRRVCERALKIDPNLERLEAVVMKLDKVSADVSTFFRLIENTKQEQQVLEVQLWKDRETGCLPKNDLIGRGEEMDFVMQWLRKPTNEDPTHIPSPTLYKNISLLSIVGHGGMGKTTLLQHIYEDLKEEFELKMWVCVSNDFDAKKVIADMLEFLNEERPRLESPLAVVQQRLKAAVQSKRFLLVLDDIWEEDMSKWENVLSPLTNGSFGSKILITTRMDAVASGIAKIIKKKMETLRIRGLEEAVCLKLLKTHAFAGVENLGAHKKLTNIACLIVKKLFGSPLAAKVIGSALNSNLNESFWMNILNSPDVLNVEPEPGRNNILPILTLSFKFLPQPLQNCFAFCGIFPQDHEFDKEDLVRMWIALGFIQESFVEGDALEDIGGRYFDVLVRKSFFDEFQYEEIIYYKMHDVLHDLAQSISSEECFRFVGDKVLTFPIPKSVRHLFVKTENREVLRMIKDVKNLHSLFLINMTNDQVFTEMLIEIFKASKSIRLLFISSPCQIKISETIKNLRHLRYLNLRVDLTQMPRSLSSLYHLRFIINKDVVLRSCYDDFLPCDVSNLSNLRHLELPPNAFSSVPEIGKLSSLQELNEFILHNENGFRIGELEHMSELRKLKLHFLENVNDATEARNAKLFEKRKLTHLFLNWGNTVGDWNSYRGVGSLRNIVNSNLDVNLLENLKPYKNLKRLIIFSYKGVSSPKWMYNAVLISNLEYISLNGCSEWETLPPFGQLPHLKSLYLCNMPKAKRIDYKFYGNDKVSVFPSLEVLNIEGLQVLEDWFDVEGAAADDCFFPCLTELLLYNCPNLQELPYLPPMLKKMEIHNIGWKAALICRQETNNCCGISKSIPLETLQALSCPNSTSPLSFGGLQRVENGIEKFQLVLREVVIDDLSLLPTVSIASFEKLTICNNDVLQSLPSSLERLSSLKILSVVKIPQLQQLLHIPASLKKLHLECLESLQCLPTSLSTISSLNHLSLNRIDLLKSLPDLPSSLSSLSLCSLASLQRLPSPLSAISSLNDLTLSSIPFLKSLPDLPSSLKSLSLEKLDNLECLPSSLSAISSLNRLYLDRIPLLKSLPDLPSSLNTIRLQFLESLRCLPSYLSAISSLKDLSLRSIPFLKSLPGLPSSLNSLSLLELNNLDCLPSSLSAISSLNLLDLCFIPLLKLLPDLPSSLNTISLKFLKSLRCLPSSLSAISSLKDLSLSSIPFLKSLPDLPSSLNSLSLVELDNLKSLPSSLSAISSLNRLYLDRIPLLKSLPDLPSSLNTIHLQFLESLQCLPSSLSAISSLKDLSLGSIPFLKSLPDLPSSLNSLLLERLDNLECLPSLSAISSLNCLTLYRIPLLKALPELPPSLNTIRLKFLESLRCLPSSLSVISSLKNLSLSSIPFLKSLPDLPSSLKSLSLERLDNLECLPSTLSAISSLKDLSLGSIPFLKSLPDLPSSLNTICLKLLESLRCLPFSLSAISSLNDLSLSSIPFLKSLPDLPSSLNSLSLERLDNLECLPSSLSAISSLNRLYLESIPLLKSLPDLPSSLNSLSLRSLDNLQCLPSSLSAISSLKFLALENIPLLKSLPDFPSSMDRLVLDNCSPELMRCYKKFSGSDWHKILHIPHVRIGTDCIYELLCL